MKPDDLKPAADQSGNVPTDPPQPKQAEFTWASLAKIMAAVGTVGGLVMHLVGYITHQSYLTAWGIDPGLFPKAVDDIAMTGYYAVIDRSASILSIMKDEAWKLLGPGVAIMVYAFILLRLSKSEKRKKIVRVFQQIPDWVSDLAKSLGVTTVVLGSVPIALFLTIFALFVPAIFGHTYGISLAEREQKTYMAGCTQAGSSKCIELRKDGKTIARGFTLESSTSHLAIFDVHEMRARAIERAGTELIADTPRKMSEGNEGRNPASANH